MFGRGKSKEDLLIENAKLEVHVELLTKQNSELISQVSVLQQALVAKESPKAYEDQVSDRLNARNYKDVDPKIKQRQDIISAYLELSESDRLFEEPGDMDDLLASFATTTTDHSVSGNDEG